MEAARQSPATGCLVVVTNAESSVAQRHEIRNRGASDPFHQVSGKKNGEVARPDE
jgi:hypothetical protein